MNSYNIFRFICVLLLWLGLCYIMISRRGLDFIAVFSIIASGIIVFVPIYKKYKREKR